MSDETSQNRLYSPYDSEVYRAEKAEQNIMPTSPNEISHPLEIQTTEQRNLSRREAVRKVAELPNVSEEVYSIVKEAVEKNKSREDIINMLIGYSARILSQGLSVDKCRTIYKSTEIGVLPHTCIPTPEYLDIKYNVPQRKDLVLLAHFFDMEAPKLNPKKGSPNHLEEEQIQQTKNDVLYVLSNYKQVLSDWVKENRIQEPKVQREQLIRWYIGHKHHKPEGAASKTQNVMINEAFRYISYNEKEVEKSILTNFHDPVYMETSIPPTLLIDKNDTVVGAIEITAYSKNEVKALADVLEKITDLTYKREDPIEDHDRMMLLDSYDLRGLQVNIPKDYKDKNVAGMRLGLNISGIRNFIQIVNHPKSDRFRYDLIDPHTGEVKSLREAPVFWRLPDDIPDEEIDKLGRLATKLGYSNLIIQKLPFTREDIKILGHALFFKTFKMEKTAKTDALRNKNTQTKDMFSQLINRDNWLKSPEK